jgi:hypothetical protein
MTANVHCIMPHRRYSERPPEALARMAKNALQFGDVIYSTNYCRKNVLLCRVLV